MISGIIKIFIMSLGLRYMHVLNFQGIIHSLYAREPDDAGGVPVASGADGDGVSAEADDFS